MAAAAMKLSTTARNDQEDYLHFSMFGNLHKTGGRPSLLPDTHDGGYFLYIQALQRLSEHS